MRATVGDWLIVHSRRLDDGVREGQIVEVAHPDGSPPYVVRWLDEERPSVVFPGSDATIRPDPPPHRPPGGLRTTRSDAV